jgi:hypothetical protein
VTRQSQTALSPSGTPATPPSRTTGAYLSRTLREHARRRGWRNLRLLSCGMSTFKCDLRSEDAQGNQDSTVAVFTRNGDGSLRHSYSAHPWLADDVRERGLDLLCPLWNVLGRGVHSWGISVLVPTCVIVPPGPVSILLRTIQAPKFAILLVLLSQVRTIGALFTIVPAVVVSVRPVVHVEADAGSTPYSTSQGNHEDERSELFAHMLSCSQISFQGAEPRADFVEVPGLFVDKLHTAVDDGCICCTRSRPVAMTRRHRI